MILYICNRCKKTTDKKKVTTVQTKRGEDVSVAHLCPSCLSHIKNLCETDMKQCDDIAEAPNVSDKNSGKMSDGGAIMKNMIEHHDNATAKNFPINVESFADSILKKPRTSTLQSVQRILLCIYKGMSLSDIGNLVRKQYQEVYRVKTCYTCKSVAQLHLEKERMDYDVVSIVDTFIKCGSIADTAEKLTMDESKVQEVISLYTGLVD